MKVAVTGASGFIGRNLIDKLSRTEGVSQIVALSRTELECPERTEWVKCQDLSADDALGVALQGVDVLIHAAAVAQAPVEDVADAAGILRRANVDATLNIAQQARTAGVKRFVFISSAKVNGETTTKRSPFLPDEPPAPAGAYAVSKRDAEEGLRQLAASHGMDFVIIRPPLVYGPGVKGNFLSLLRIVKKRLPLPFGAIGNRRSMIFVGNLTDFIALCCVHPDAANEVFLVSDDQDLSTTQLLRQLAAGLGVSAPLISIPAAVLALGFKLLRREEMAERLLGDMVLDIEKTKRLLGWTPPHSVAVGIQETAEDFQKRSF